MVLQDAAPHEKLFMHTDAARTGTPCTRNFEHIQIFSVGKYAYEFASAANFIAQLLNAGR
jgi:hypothetical protein